MVPSPHLGGDNGPEFVARALLKWLADQGIETALIDLSCSGDVDPGLERAPPPAAPAGFGGKPEAPHCILPRSMPSAAPSRSAARNSALALIAATFPRAASALALRRRHAAQSLALASEISVQASVGKSAGDRPMVLGFAARNFCPQLAEVCGDARVTSL